MSKKSFVLYQDWGEAFTTLPDEDAGKLIKAIYGYIFNEEVPDVPVSIAPLFNVMRPQIDRDAVKWEETLKKRSMAGKKSAAVKKAKVEEPAPASPPGNWTIEGGF